MKYIPELLITQELLDKVIFHCKEVYPKEACGILAGKDGVVKRVYTMWNMENSHISYMMDPKEQFAIMKEMRKDRLDMIAIYHSHPDFNAYPSPKDIKLASYPDSAYVIVSLLNKESMIRAFRITDEQVTEVEMKVILK